MIDLETLGNKPGFLIFEIGLVAFRGDRIVGVTREVFSYSNSLRKGMRSDPETKIWWRDKMGGIPKRYTKDSGNEEISVTLQKITDFIHLLKSSPKEEPLMWSYSFMDPPMLAAYYEKCNLPQPWKRWHERELRTALQIMGVNPRISSNEHTALGDASNQTKILINARKAFYKAGAPQPYQHA